MQRMGGDNFTEHLSCPSALQQLLGDCRKQSSCSTAAAATAAMTKHFVMVMGTLWAVKNCSLYMTVTLANLKPSFF